MNLDVRVETRAREGHQTSDGDRRDGWVEAHGERSGVGVEDDPHGARERVLDLGGKLARNVGHGASGEVVTGTGEGLRCAGTHGRVGVFARLVGIAACLFQASSKRCVDQRSAGFDQIAAPPTGHGGSQPLGHRRVELAGRTRRRRRCGGVERGESLAPCENEGPVGMGLDDARRDGHDARLARSQGLGQRTAGRVAELRVTGDEIQRGLSHSRVMAARKVHPGQTPRSCERLSVEGYDPRPFARLAVAHVAGAEHVRVPRPECELRRRGAPRSRRPPQEHGRRAGRRIEARDSPQGSRDPLGRVVANRVDGRHQCLETVARQALGLRRDELCERVGERGLPRLVHAGETVRRLGPLRRREVAGVEHARERRRRVCLTGATESSHGEDPARALMIEGRKRSRHEARPELVTRPTFRASERIERRRERRRALRGFE